jgi:hypothetical protein
VPPQTVFIAVPVEHSQVSLNTRRKSMNSTRPGLRHRSGALPFSGDAAPTGHPVNTAEKAMSYRVSYEGGWPGTSSVPEYKGVTRTEYFRTEHEALRRARMLLDGDHEGVVVHDSSGGALAGIPLRLRLGVAVD